MQGGPSYRGLTIATSQINPPHVIPYMSQPGTLASPLLHPTPKMPQQTQEDPSTTEPLLASSREYAQSRASGEAQRGTFKKNLGAIEAFGIIISIVIGSGVFTSPGSIDTNVPSPGFALIIWLVGGVLAWTGAVTFAELGTAIPGEGEHSAQP